MKSNSLQQKRGVKKARKTNKELAEYLAFVNPHRKEMYFAIADFFGVDNPVTLTPKKK